MAEVPAQKCVLVDEHMAKDKADSFCEGDMGKHDRGRGVCWMGGLDRDTVWRPMLVKRV